MPSHKTLKSVARSVAESFASLMNYRDDDYVLGHIVYAAWSTGATRLRVDLLDGTVESSGLLTEPVAASIRYYVESFPDLVVRSKSDMRFVGAAELEVEVDPAKRGVRMASGFEESPYRCTVRIVDDRGKVHAHRVSGWWYPEKVPPPNRPRPWWRFW